MPDDHRKRLARSFRRAVRCQVEVLERREVLSPAGSSLLGGLAHNPAALTRHAAAISAATAGDVISVSPSAWKYATRALAGSSYTVEPLRSAAVPAVGAVVVTGADLLDPRMVAMLRAVYNSGQTVALTDATKAAAGYLRGLLGHQGSAQWTTGVARVALVAFRKVQENGAAHFSSDVLPWKAVAAAPQGSPGAGAAPGAPPPLTASWLDRVFATTPTVPTPPPGASESNLLDLACSYESSTIGTGPNEDAVQIVNTIWDARSFHNQMDFYYDLQEVDYTNGTGQAPWHNTTYSVISNPSGEVLLFQPSPESTQQTTSVTSGVSESIGASVGFNQAQGFNVSLSASTTITNSKTVSVPPLQIQDLAVLKYGIPEWRYIPSNPQPAGTTLTFYNQWIWGVPFSSYSSGQKQLELYTESYEYINGMDAAGAVYNVRVPLPFGDTFKILKPTVTGVSSPTVRPGDTFTITGTGLYPSLVTSVLIGGQPLTPAQYATVSDTAITVVAPDLQGSDLPVVIKTTKGVSNDNVVISIT